MCFNNVTFGRILQISIINPCKRVFKKTYKPLQKGVFWKRNFLGDTFGKTFGARSAPKPFWGDGILKNVGARSAPKRI